VKFQTKRFYHSTDDLKQFHGRLKQTPCPHCKSVGFLNLHGYLRGYDEKTSAQRITRGRRVFCCHRNNRKGCGKTFSLLVAGVLKKFIISAKSFWQFLKNILKGSNTITAFKSIAIALARSSCYRLWKIFRLRQAYLRSQLLRLCPKPVSPTHSPVLETILHLGCAFNNTSCPIIAFQNKLQISFL
jgi:hypothetical protein